MGKPIKGNKSDNMIVGTDKNDKLQGKDGDDTLKGGKGDDSIDGGKGTDTAVYDGNYADYTITFANTGNDKTTVKDNNLTNGNEGTDSLKNVEYLKFNDAVVDISNGVVWQYSFGELDEAAQEPGTEDMINGDGIPAANFGLARNEAAGLELGLKLHHRDGDGSDYLPTGPYDDGVLHYNVEDGPAAVGGIPKAEWSWDFSIATGLNGATTDLDDFNFQLLVDMDPSDGVDYAVWELAPGGSGSSAHHWQDADTLAPVWIDDEGNANVTQNSRNYGFGEYAQAHANGYGPPAFTYAGGAQFDIELRAFDATTNVLLAQNHIVVDVVL